jgi:GNAT superfamily N-acetyltransferase
MKKMMALKSAVVEGFLPGYLGRITQMHGEYYAKAWGSGPAFEMVMARELCDFYEDYTPNRDLLLTAHVDGKLVGSIVVDGSEKERPGARLRWYIVDEGYQGKGLGRQLLIRALDFCRKQSFKTIYIWTVEGLPKSRHLYESIGMNTVESFTDDRYTLPLVNLRMEISIEELPSIIS